MTPPVGRGGTWLARALATALTLGITLAGHGQGNDKGATRMDARDQLSAKLQALPDEVYLRKDRSAVSSLPREALSLRFQGFCSPLP